MLCCSLLFVSCSTIRVSSGQWLSSWMSSALPESCTSTFSPRNSCSLRYNSDSWQMKQSPPISPFLHSSIPMNIECANTNVNTNTIFFAWVTTLIHIISGSPITPFLYHSLFPPQLTTTNFSVTVSITISAFVIIISRLLSVLPLWLISISSSLARPPFLYIPPPNFPPKLTISIWSWAQFQIEAWIPSSPRL